MGSSCRVVVLGEFGSGRGDGAGDVSAAVSDALTVTASNPRARPQCVMRMTEAENARRRRFNDMSSSRLTTDDGNYTEAMSQASLSRIHAIEIEETS